jgi:hypothetical protein
LAAKSNEFYRWAYQRHQIKVDWILGINNKQENKNSSEFPTVLVFSCFCLALATILMILIIRIRKTKNNKKELN